MSGNGLLPLTEVRARAALALAPATDDDPVVLSELVDSLAPPALMLEWDDPWIEPKTIGNGAAAGYWEARLQVLCVASRLEPGAGVETLERLVTHAIGRLRDDSYSWPAATLQAPRIFRIQGINYLGARVGYRVPVTV